MVNDISGLRYEPDLARSWREHGAPIILMHTRGRSRDMYKQAVYGDVVDEVLDELRESMAFAAGAGIRKERMLVDPGLGFAKEAPHSFEVLARLDEFSDLGCPLVVGPSRKSFLTRRSAGVRGRTRDWATAAAVTAAVMRARTSSASMPSANGPRSCGSPTKFGKYHRDRLMDWLTQFAPAARPAVSGGTSSISCSCRS